MTGTRPRVVVADDYAPMMRSLARLLSSDCDIVGSATTAAELLKESTTHGPDVVVVDLYLADETGIDVCQRLRAMQPSVKVVIVSAEDDPDICTAAFGAGASAFVPKYMAHAQLLPAILRLCSR